MQRDEENYYYYTKRVTGADGVVREIEYRKAKNLVLNPRKRGPKRKLITELISLARTLDEMDQTRVIAYIQSIRGEDEMPPLRKSAQIAFVAPPEPDEIAPEDRIATADILADLLDD